MISHAHRKSVFIRTSAQTENSICWTNLQSSLPSLCPATCLTYSSTQELPTMWLTPNLQWGFESGHGFILQRLNIFPLKPQTFPSDRLRILHCWASPGPQEEPLSSLHYASDPHFGGPTGSAICPISFCLISWAHVAGQDMPHPGGEGVYNQRCLYYESTNHLISACQLCPEEGSFCD